MDVIRDFYSRFRELIHEIAKFGIVGALAYLITQGGTNVLNSGFGLGWLTSVTIATVVATLFAFVGNRQWAFKHRRGRGLGREGLLFFWFNGIGLLIQLGFVGAVVHGLGYNDTLSANVALFIGIGVATLVRLYCYQRWVFPKVPVQVTATEQLEPETSGR